MLLTRSRSDDGTAADRAAWGAEAVKWLMLAANQGDKRGQVDMADVLLTGKLVKQDLIEAYKWSDLAAHGSTDEAAIASCGSIRDAAVLKMSADQITEAKKRVADFKPQAPRKEEWVAPVWDGQVKLTGLSGAPGHRLAILNGKTFAQGESGEVKANGKIIQVHCLEIRENSVVAEIEGFDKPIEIVFSGK